MSVSAFSLATLTAGEWVILPGEIELKGPEARQHLLVLERSGEAFSGEIEGADWKSSHPEIVKVVDGELVAVSNGTAVITAAKGGRKISETVDVSGVEKNFEWSFNRHVLPVLTRQGCNMGACHGAVAGKGGFRLSLRGYDPPADHYWLTKEARGRRIEVAAPTRSLLVTKPTMATPHKGGKRLDSDSREYRILAEWVAAGAVAPDEAEAKIDRIEVAPELSILKKGDKQRLIVTAHYHDGTSMDVTDWAKFASADEAIAIVDESGEVEIIGYGEGAVSALFSSNVSLARFRSPFSSGIDPDVFSRAPRANFIDELVLAQLEQLQLKPSGRSNDGDFIRRVFLDTIGSLPTLEETQGFLEDKNPDKRKNLINSLLQRPEFVDYWTYRWADVFLVNGQVLRPDAVKAYYDWIRSGVKENLPWDEMARQLVTATGVSTESGATNFYAVHQDPENMAENVSQAFLSLSINCAKCHDHPLEKWTNDQYYAFANIFSRVRAKGWGGDPRNGDGVRTIYVEPRGDLIQPRTGKPQIPAPLDGAVIDPDDTSDRREALAAWLTDPGNEYFSRSITNRVWAAFFGDGLVSPVDDLRASNPASNEPLLNALAAHLVKSDFNLKALMRVILMSETYQRSGEVLSENIEDTKYHSRYFPRRLMSEVLYDAILDVTQVPTVFGNIVLRDGSTQKTEFYEAGTKALQLYDSAVQSYFLKTFGRNEREITCECERSNQPSMVQALHLSNGDTLNEKLANPNSIVAKLLGSDAPDKVMLEQAYLSTLTRMPTKEESARLLTHMEGADEAEKKLILEDLFWALMTSREFLFQH